MIVILVIIAFVLQYLYSKHCEKDNEGGNSIFPLPMNDDDILDYAEAFITGDNKKRKAKGDDIINNITKKALGKKKEKMKKRSTIILYHADHCGHCQDFKPEWKKFTEMAKDIDINVKDINCADGGCDKPYIRGVPTVVLEHEGKKIIFNSERSADELMKFVKKYV